MTLLSEIIQDAYRESNLIAVDRVPTAAEQSEGLRLLNQVILALVGNEGGDKLSTLPLGRNNISRPQGFPVYDTEPYPNWFVPLNTRVLLNLEAEKTIYLHPKPEDGSRFAFMDKSGNLSSNNLTVNANGYTIEDDDSVVFNTDSLAKEYFFRADTGNWGVVTPLTAVDDSPFPADFDILLTAGLAMRLNPRNSIAADPQTVQAYRDNLRKFKARYNQVIEVGSELGLIRTLLRRHLRYYSNYDDFGIGRANVPDYFS